MLSVQQRFHHRGGVLTAIVPQFLKAEARRVLHWTVREAHCRVHISIFLYPDPILTRINWRIERRGKVQRGSRFVVLRSSDFAVYNDRVQSVAARRAEAPFALPPVRWFTAVKFAVGDILLAVNSWAAAPVAQRESIRLAEVEGVDYGLV